MELTNHREIERSFRTSSVIGSDQGRVYVMTAPVAGMTSKPSRMSTRPSLGGNFSYPRPEGPSRHESSESRSSLKSDGSMPGMTDASDSDTSIDDDYQYNTFASQLWDSFWPNGYDLALPRKQSQGRFPQPTRSGDYFSFAYTYSPGEDSDDDIVAPRRSEPRSQSSRLSQRPSASTLRSSTYQAQATRPRYPVQPPAPSCPARAAPPPPRSSSLIPEETPLPLPPRRRFLSPSRSFANLRASRLGMSTPPPQQQAPAPISVYRPSFSHAKSLPVSPAHSRSGLRTVSSASSLREQTFQLKTQMNPTAPLSPITQSVPSQSRPTRPQLERFVSVFEVDSDNESDTETNSLGSSGFAKRIARGLHHKKSASTERRAATPAPDSEGSTDDDVGLGRKRGGSLGRILGLKGW